MALLTILDYATAVAVGAATSQQANLEALLAPFGAGPVTARLEGPTGTHLRTLTIPLPTIEATTPRRFTLAAHLADAAVATGAPGRWVFRTSGGLSVFSIPAGTGGSSINHVDDVKTLCTPTLQGVVVTAPAGLPAISLPAWLAAMTLEDRIYNVSGNVPGVAPGLLPNPLPDHFGVWSESASFGAGVDVMSGYGSGTHLQGQGGTFGTMVYGTGGHTRLQNQLLGLNLSLDSPTFFWWRNAEFQTADSAGCDLYHAPAEAAAIGAGPRAAVAVVNMSGGESSFAAAWDGAFPVATTTGWVYPRQMKSGTLGNNAPHGYRYTAICEVPASVTGSDPCLLVGGPRPQGPFALSEYPSGVDQALWFDPAWRYPSGRRRWPWHLLNLRTGEWSIVGVFPDVATVGFQGCSLRADPARRRVWASFEGVNPGTLYLDFSGGLGSVTVSAATFASVTGSHSRNAYSSGALTVGHPSKLLWYWIDGNDPRGLFGQDVLSGTTFWVGLTAAGFGPIGGHEKVGMSYDAPNNRLLIVQPINVLDPSAGIEYWSIPVPADHTNASAYTVTRRTLSVDSSVTSLVAASEIAEFYGKAQLLPMGVILLPFSKGRMLGFRPSV